MPQFPDQNLNELNPVEGKPKSIFNPCSQADNKRFILSLKTFGLSLVGLT